MAKGPAGFELDQKLADKNRYSVLIYHNLVKPPTQCFDKSLTNTCLNKLKALERLTLLLANTVMFAVSYSWSWSEMVCGWIVDTTLVCIFGAPTQHLCSNTVVAVVQQWLMDGAPFFCPPG